MTFNHSPDSLPTLLDLLLLPQPDSPVISPPDLALNPPSPLTTAPPHPRALLLFNEDAALFRLLLRARGLPPSPPSCSSSLVVLDESLLIVRLITELRDVSSLASLSCPWALAGSPVLLDDNPGSDARVIGSGGGVVGTGGGEGGVPPQICCHRRKCGVRTQRVQKNGECVFSCYVCRISS